MSELRRSRRLATLAVLGTTLATAALSLPAEGKEATARGKKANITWIDEKGVRQQMAARDISFGYYDRTYLKVPKDGRNFKDDVREVKGIPLAQDFIGFTLIDKVEFHWETDPNSGVSRLAVNVSLANGKERSGSGTSLAGASHPTSPYISFTVDGAPHRIDLNPLGSEADRAGKPQLVSMVFTL